MKKIIKAPVYFSFNWTYGISIAELKADIENLEKLGVTTIDIETYDDYGSPSLSIEAFQERIETDEEYKARIDEEKDRVERVKKYELEQLALLKLKYKEIS